MAEVTVKIDGMSCQHCVMRVKKALDAAAGVSASDVAVGSARVTFDDKATSADAIKAVIQKAGYKVAG